MGYMRAVADMYQSAYRALGPSLMPLDFFQPRAEPPGSAAVPPEPNRPSSEQAIAELQQRIEELERRVRKPEKGKRAKKRAAGRQKR
jgi:hypothetical protein